MKYLVVLASVLAVASAQRPGYLQGRGPIGYPRLASRFQTNDGSSTTQTPSLENRNGLPTQKIPVDALGDVDLVNRLNQLPRDHRPFWLLNSEQIEAQRNPQKTAETAGTIQQAHLANRFIQNVHHDVNQEPEESFYYYPVEAEVAKPDNYYGYSV